MYHGHDPGEEIEAVSLKARQGWWTTKDTSAQTVHDYLVTSNDTHVR